MSEDNRTRGVLLVKLSSISIFALACAMPLVVQGLGPESESAVRYREAPRVPEHKREQDRPWVGGHVNLALPVVEFRTGHTKYPPGEGPGRAVLAVGRDFGTLGLAPGITAHLNHRWAIDFEFVAYSDCKNDITSVVFDPGSGTV